MDQYWHFLTIIVKYNSSPDNTKQTQKSVHSVDYQLNLVSVKDHICAISTIIKAILVDFSTILVLFNSDHIVLVPINMYKFRMRR